MEGCGSPYGFVHLHGTIFLLFWVGSAAGRRPGGAVRLTLHQPTLKNKTRGTAAAAAADVGTFGYGYGVRGCYVLFFLFWFYIFFLSETVLYFCSKGHRSRGKRS